MMRHIRHRRRPRPEISWKNPRALALCDGCRLLVNRDVLVMQTEYRGGSVPVPTGMLKCPACLDVPNVQLKKLVLTPDPVPVVQPRPDNDTDSDSYPSYASVAALPAASSLPAGYRVDVTIDGSTVAAYASGTTWRRYSNNSVIV